jgi:hypothetical protein
VYRVDKKEQAIWIYKLEDAVYTAEILVPGYINTWAQVCGPNGNQLFENKVSAIEAMKLELMRRRVALTEDERQRKKRGR